MLSQSSTTVTPPPPSSMSSMAHSVTHSFCSMWHVKHIIKDPGINAVNELFQIHHHHHQTVSPLWLAWHSPTEQLLWVCPRDDDKRMMMRCWLAGWLAGRGWLGDWAANAFEASHTNLEEQLFSPPLTDSIQVGIGTPVTVSKITATNNESICVA